MIASPPMPTRTELLNELVRRETMRTQQRMARLDAAEEATARLAATLSRQRVLLEQQLTAVSARLSRVAAQCEYYTANCRVAHRR